MERPLRKHQLLATTLLDGGILCRKRNERLTDVDIDYASYPFAMIDYNSLMIRLNTSEIGNKSEIAYADEFHGVLLRTFTNCEREGDPCTNTSQHQMPN